jgi:CHAT domain-containing protein
MRKKTQAINSYKQSISVLSSIREELFNGIRLKTDIFEIDVKPVYLGLAGIYLEQADIESNPQVKEEKILLARDVMESLKNAELADYFEDECVASKHKIETNKLTRTPEGVALLYPIALPDRLTVLITLPDAIKHYNVDIRYNELNKLVRSYRKYIQVRSSNQFLGVSQKIYQLLIHPVEKDLIAANIHTLLVAPDGVLRLVPFASLHDKKKFLIEKYAIVTIPSINMTDTTVSHYNKEEAETLVVGLSDAVQDFSALPSINEELRDINKIMNGKKIYKNTEYTISNVQNEFKTNDYNIVHFATHGVFGGTGKNSFLLTYESQLDMNKLEDLMSLGKYRNHQVDMLTLSACQTALGNERAALGLAGVAVKAGVKSAVATLWYVDDQATSLAIRELYRQLKKDNMTKAKALQNAQRMLLNKRQYWHPIYWAPFLLIGNWS